MAEHESILARASRLLFGARPAPDTRPPSNPSIVVVLADLTGRDVDAIVNAADWTLLGGTGVDGAIHAKAGAALGRHIVERGLRLETDGVHATPGFGLKARRILHTCAPTYETGSDPRDALGLCYLACVRRADSMGLSTLSFPLLGAGAFGWPSTLAATICAQALREAGPACRSLLRIEVCAFNLSSARALESAMGTPFEMVDDPSTLNYHPGASALEGLTAQEISRRF